MSRSRKSPASTPATAKRPAPAAAPAKAPAFHVNAYGIVGYQQFAAKESFGAIFGRSGKAVFGGGAQVWHRSGLFVQGDYSKYQDDGQRVFISNGAVFPLGIPLRLDLGFFDVGVGYKFIRKAKAPKLPKPATPPTPRRDDAGAPARWQTTPATPAPAKAAPPKPAPRPPAKAGYRITPYLAGGFGRGSYTETADFSQAGDNVSQSYSSYHVLGGVELPLWKWVGVNLEGQYRWVPNALGENGVSAEFGEKDLGGPAFRVKLTVGR